MPSVKLTKYLIDKIPLTTSGQVFIRDSELKGFGVRIGAQSKSFFCEKKINGKVNRITIGGYPALSVEQARKMAQEIMVKLLSGIDVAQEKQTARIKRITLGQVYDDFKRSRTLTKKTLSGYDSVMRLYYGDWLDVEVSAISKNMIEDRHLELSEKRGKASANQAGRTIRSIFNFAIGKYELSNGKAVITENPTIRLSQTRQWHHVKRKVGHLKPHELKSLLEEISRLRNRVVADYISFIIFTGCRRAESASLRWENVNLKNRSFILPDTKNHHSLELPLTTHLMELMKIREVLRENEFVFPAKSKSGHIEEPKKIVHALGEKIGHHFTLHDLRRTYITITESLDISHYAIKALVNHKMSQSDVTAGYVQMSVERLREPMQKITDFILNAVDQKS